MSLKVLRTCDFWPRIEFGTSQYEPPTLTPDIGCDVSYYFVSLVEFEMSVLNWNKVDINSYRVKAIKV
jgi:hypothetical protein